MLQLYDGIFLSNLLKELMPPLTKTKHTPAYADLEDQKDLKDFKARADEPTISYKALLKKLKANDKIKRT